MPLPMQQITREHTRVPKDAHDYDWRTEPWLDESLPTDFDMHAAASLLVAMACMGETADAQDLQDAQVFALLRPDLMEQAFKSPAGRDILHPRLWHAAAQCLAVLRQQWIKTYGSLDAKGRKVR